LGHCHQRESACSGMFHKWECTNLMWSGLDDVICAYDERDDAIHAREEVKAHRILAAWASSQAILETAIIFGAVRHADMA
jgi:hypothetical protein